MNPIQGVDYSTQPPPGAKALKDAGVQFACRYLATDGRGITKPEIADLNAFGIKIVLIYETDGLGFRSGAVTGKADATAAQGHIVRLGLPLNSPVYFTVDDQFNPADVAPLQAYLAACATVLGSPARVCLYGPLAAVEAASGHARCLWQTSGWSGVPTVWHPGNTMEQYGYHHMINGVDCDDNRALTADYGQIGGSVPAKITYPDGMDAGIAKRFFGSVKASNGVTVSYSEDDELSKLWLASGSYGRIVDVGVYQDSPTITRLIYQFSDGQSYHRPNANEPITRIGGTN